jgi:hypothetical protein
MTGAGVAVFAGTMIEGLIYVGVYGYVRAGARRGAAPA